jgi:hypothetical protein
MIKTLNEDNKSHKNYLDNTHFNTLGPLLNKVLTQVRESKTNSMKSISGIKKNFDLDEEDMLKVREELSK